MTRRISLHDKIGLMLLIGQLANGNLITIVVVGTQPAIDPIAIETNDVVRHRHDTRGGPVIDLQVDPLRFVKRLLKVENVANVGLPPAIDRLIRIADHEKVLMPLGKRLYQHVLHAVGVLVLVDQNVVKALLIAFEQPRFGFEKPERQDEQIVEIDRVRFAKQSLVFRVGPRHDLVAEVRGGLPRFFRADHARLVRADARTDAPRRKLLRILTDVGDRLFDDRLLIRIVIDREVTQDP